MYLRELANWNKRSGTEEFLTLYAELQMARASYFQLKNEDAAEIANLRDQRKNAHLRAYLDTFTVEHANLKGVGPAIKAALASYGIDTAAGIVDGSINNVPGVGKVLSQRLLDWRKRLTGQFVYRPARTPLDQSAIVQAQLRAETKAAPLRATLSVGPQNLTLLATRIRQFASREDVVVGQAARQRDQAKCDLGYLGIAIPNVPDPTPAAAPVQRATQIVLNVAISTADVAHESWRRIVDQVRYDMPEVRSSHGEAPRSAWHPCR